MENKFFDLSYYYSYKYDYKNQMNKIMDSPESLMRSYEAQSLYVKTTYKT